MLSGKKSEALLRPQGLLAPEILVTLADRDSADAEALPEALVRFCTWCIEEAWLVRDEVQPDAWPIYHANHYIAEVRNGGHGQFAGNSAMRTEVLDDIELGLARLGLDDLMGIFRRFRSALAQDAALKAVVMDGGGFGEIPAAIRALDDAFLASPDPKRFFVQASNWLKAAPTVPPLTPRELRARQAAIIASNALLDQRRAVALRQPPGARFKQAASRLWDRIGFRRPGETTLDQLRRRVADNPSPEWQASDAYAPLIEAFPDAVQDGDEAQVDRMLAEFRNIHARYKIETTTRWPADIRMYAAKLHYAGERLDRIDLLEQAADAFGRSIATGTTADYDPGFDLRSLGQALVALARLDEAFVAGLTDAIDAFAKAGILDAEKQDYRLIRTLLGRAEAHLLLAANGRDGALDTAGEALAEAKPLLTKDDRNRWEAVDAELFSLRPRAETKARDRARAVSQLDRAIAWEVKHDGAPIANAARLGRLRRLRSEIAEG